MGQLLISLLGAASELTKTWKQMVITVVFMGLTGSGILGYQFMTKWIDEYGHYQDIVNRLHLDETVQTSMDQFRHIINGDRIVVGELHDGKVNMSGIRFGYVSATYESTSPGVSHLLTQMQNMPTSMFAGYWTDLIEGKCTLLSRSVQGSITPTMDSFMIDNGIKHMYFCPVNLPGQKDKLIGVSMGMWMNSDHIGKFDDYRESLEDMSLVISGAVMRKN